MRSISLVVLGIFVGIAAVVTVTSFAKGQPRLTPRTGRTAGPTPAPAAPQRVATGVATKVPAVEKEAGVYVGSLEIYQAGQSTFLVTHFNGALEALPDGADLWLAFTTDPAIQTALITQRSLQGTRALITTATKSGFRLKRPSIKVVVRKTNGLPEGCPSYWRGLAEARDNVFYEIVRVRFFRY